MMLYSKVNLLRGQQNSEKENKCMKNLRLMNETETREANGGAKRYFCPWKDYSSTSYWKTYAHAVGCAARRGLFDLPIKLIKAGIRLL